MSLIRKAYNQRALGDTPTELIPPRLNINGGAVTVNQDTALRHSAVWASLTLRANLVSSTPVDVYRIVDGIQVEVPKTPFLISPGGDKVHLSEWLYSSQFDLDRYGNCFGVITKRDGFGFPAQIVLVSASSVTVIGKGSEITGYRIDNKVYAPEDIWHEKNVTVPGSAVGLSPIGFAAYSIGNSLSAQQFSVNYYAAGPQPKGVLRHTQQDILAPGVAEEASKQFKAVTALGDVFVTGKAWEFTPLEMESAGSAFLEEMRYGVVEVARFMGVPADMIDGGVSGQSVTYANVTQRNLQFLIMNLGPAIKRREDMLSTYALAKPRFLKFNTDAILRMDPVTRTELLLKQVQGKTLAPSEARAIDNRQPFTEDQLAEFDRLFGRPGMRVTESTPGTTVPPTT